MKSIKIFATSLLSALLIYSCGGGGTTSGGSSGTGTTSNEIVIKGKLSSLVFSREKGMLNSFKGFFIPKAYASVSNISKVIIFTESGHYWISNVNNGSFSVSVNRGIVTGLIFIDNNNRFVGYLNLKEGLDSLPLTKIKTGINEINLGDLSLSGTTFRSSRNPLNEELPFTEEERINLEIIDDFFSSVVKNPDKDGNGTVDLMENKFYRLGILYFVKGGSFGSNFTPTVNQTAVINGYRLSFDAVDQNRPSQVCFSGPSGSGLNQDCSSQSNVFEKSTTYFSSYVGFPHGSQGSIVPQAGIYRVTYKGQSFSFEIPDQSYAQSRIVLAIPTITLNSDETINKINWKYRMPAGNTDLSPTALIKTIEVQIDGSGQQCESYPQPSRIYNSGMQKPEVVEHKLKCQNIKWSNVSRIYMAYNDVYGNHYVVTWDK